MFHKLSTSILNKTAIRLSSMDAKEIINLCKKLLPPLLEGSHKGICGRLGVFGGSVEFTGAPYFASITAMRTGVDLVYVFTASSAASVIKSYSPELMVLPYLDSDQALDKISPWLLRLHGFLIGPGLGRNDKTFETIFKIIELIKSSVDDQGTYRPIIFDADGLFFLSMYPKILKNYQGDIYLTPNIMEFRNLLKSVFINELKEQSNDVLMERLCNEIGQNVTIVLKGKIDEIYNKGQNINCSEQGSNRRCGGQGDLLSGILSCFAIWAADRRKQQLPHLSADLSDNILAGYSACVLTRVSNRNAFRTYSRSMMASDMVQVYPSVFKSLFDDTTT